MGKIIACHCAECGYSKKNLFLGFGMVEGYACFPVLDSKHKTVSHIETTHFIDSVGSKEFLIDFAELKRLKDKRKIPYFEKGMFKKKYLPNEKPISDGSMHLQSKSNLCPKCGKFSLSFEEVGLFD